MGKTIFHPPQKLLISNILEIFLFAMTMLLYVLRVYKYVLCQVQSWWKLLISPKDVIGVVQPEPSRNVSTSNGQQINVKCSFKKLCV